MSKIHVKKQHTYDDIPRTWAELSAMLPLRPIHDEIELGNATEVIDWMAGHDLNPDQEDYLDTLSTLIEVYEDEHHPLDVGHVSGLDSLRALMEDQGMSASDLARLLGIHRSHGSKILKGERSLTVEHLRILSDRFKVRADLFL